MQVEIRFTLTLPDEHDEHGRVAVCANCQRRIENEDGIWWHADSMEMPCEPDDPSRDRMADPEGDDRLAALHSLAAVMAVQTEDGLYLSGNADDTDAWIDSERVDNRYLCAIERIDTDIKILED